MKEDKTIYDIIKNVSENHHQIIDDWCKAYLAELYESGEQLRPSMFALCETDLHEENGKLVKTYYVRPKNEVERKLMTEWADISTAPKDGTPILLFFENEICVGMFNLFWTACPIQCASSEPSIQNVTHWMHLPKTPQKTQKTQKTHYCKKGAMEVSSIENYKLFTELINGSDNVKYMRHTTQCTICGEKADD